MALPPKLCDAAARARRASCPSSVRPRSCWRSWRAGRRRRWPSARRRRRRWRRPRRRRSRRPTRCPAEAASCPTVSRAAVCVRLAVRLGRNTGWALLRSDIGTIAAPVLECCPQFQAVPKGGFCVLRVALIELRTGWMRRRPLMTWTRVCSGRGCASYLPLCCWRHLHSVPYMRQLWRRGRNVGTA